MTEVSKKERKICGAKTRTGGICGGKPMQNGRCRLHGGKTPIGILSGSYKHGRYSKYMPQNLSEMYENSREDPKVLELVDEIGLLDSRIAQRLKSLEEKEAANATWKALQSLWKQFMYSIRMGDTATQQLLVGDLNSLIQAGSSQADIWYELMNLVESRRKLVDSEGRRMEVKQNIVTAEQAYFLVSAVIAAMKEVVYRHADPQTARLILTDASVEHQKLISVRQDTGAGQQPVG